MEKEYEEKYDNSELIMAIKVYQRSRNTHPLTCGNESKHLPLKPKVVDGWVVLYCEECDYEQHDFPVDTVMAYHQMRNNAKIRMEDACMKCRETKPFECKFNGKACPFIPVSDWMLIHDESFKDMDEVRYYYEKGVSIKEWLCPNFDLLHPTEGDLAKCEDGKYCENHWGCHTFRHFNGSREKKNNDG